MKDFIKEECLIDSPLGKETSYNSLHDPSLLFQVPRDFQRKKIQIEHKLPFTGVDIWNAYELSWLNLKGKPEIAICEIYVPCESPYIVESKSLKLYINSFYQSTFASSAEVKACLEKSLSEAAHADVQVKLILPKDYTSLKLGSMPGTCLDDLDIETSIYTVSPQLLKTTPEKGEERVYSDLLKSNCLGTRQPDWASLYIHYQGNMIDHASLLKYIISFRTHNEFGEHCIERIFTDLKKHCGCEKLTVYGRYTRRGGIDLNPFRSDFESPLANLREYRQ